MRLESVVLRHFWFSDIKIQYTAPQDLRSSVRFVGPRSSTRYGEARRCVYIPKILKDLKNEAFSIT